MSSKYILNQLIEKGVLVEPELLQKEIDETLLKKIIENEKDLDVLNEETLNKYKNKDTNKSSVIITKNYTKPPKKRVFQDFVEVQNKKFEYLSTILQNRRELQNVTSIQRSNQSETNQTAIIGMVLEKNYTKNNNIVMKLEDKTGISTIIIKKDDRNKELFKQAEDICLDEVIGITGKKYNQAIFADTIILPDVPPTKELKKQQEEEYLVVLGDIHFGSKVFMKQEFEKFLQWIRGESGNEEQKKISKKVKYLIHTGDIVEGVGIYPDQEEDLEIKDIKEQYTEAAKWFKKIPEHIQIIITVGNHDAGRLAEPQQPLPIDLAEELHNMPNVTLVSNPAYVNIGKTDKFQGFDALMYHGGSFIYYSDQIPSIRNEGGQKRSDLIMKYLLQRRHLAPTHGSTLYIPDADQDPLLIDIIPDFFITGHIHRASAKNYRNITMINGSCWTQTTSDQVKRGLEPQPARLPIINLKDRSVKMLNFLTKESKEKEEEALKELKKVKEAEKQKEEEAKKLEESKTEEQN